MIQTWDDFFKQEQQKNYWSSWMAFLDEEYRNFTIYPSRQHLFKAFELTPLSSVKVVIFGQDPYHQPNQAHGLSFSVPEGVPLPRSLRNIYREIEDDVLVSMNDQSGDLSYLAKQGVLLLNTVLTVRAHEPLSHAHKGYDQLFFDAVMEQLNQRTQPIVFMLWGTKAHAYAPKIQTPTHLIIQTNHPSPLSANRGGWFKTKPFSRANAFLLSHGQSPIHWANQ